ncbi:MAG: energy transducer TonB [candidate division FCPU426 bacterium]
MNHAGFDHLAVRIQAALLVSVLVHAAVVSQLGPRRFSRPGQNIAITEVEYIPNFSRPRGPARTQPRPKPKEVVSLAPKPAAAEPVAPAEEPEPEEPPEGLAFNPHEPGGGLFLPFYVVEEVAAFSRRVVPVYPESAVKLGQAAKVVLEVYIDAAGEVKFVRVVKSGGPAFDQAAMEAVRNSGFKPARIQGRPVPIKLLIPYIFSLEN